MAIAIYMICLISNEHSRHDEHEGHCNANLSVNIVKTCFWLVAVNKPEYKKTSFAQLTINIHKNHENLIVKWRNFTIKEEY